MATDLIELERSSYPLFFLCLAFPPILAIRLLVSCVSFLALAGPPSLPPTAPSVLAAAVSPFCDFFLFFMAAVPSELERSS